MRIQVRAKKDLNMAKFIGAVIGVMPEMIRVTRQEEYLLCKVPFMTEEQLTDLKRELKDAKIKFISTE